MRSARCAAGRIAPARYWPSGSRASRRSRRRRRSAPVRFPAMQVRRETPLGFQPPAVGEEEIAAVAETLRSGWLTTGPNARELERRFAEYTGARHALAVSSA